MPTRNRAYTLKKVLRTYYRQKHVDQMIIINDASTDDTHHTIQKIAAEFPLIETIIVTNDSKKGAADCRNLGAQKAKNDLILFGEDDAYVAENYTDVLLRKLQANKQTKIASGRLVSLFPGENPYHAIKRFGKGNPKMRKTFSATKFSHLPEAYYQNDITLPLTHAMILTYKDLLLKFPYRTIYSKGNGFREESVYQANIFVNGYDILATNETHSMHLHPQDVRTGGHRINILSALWYKIYYTHLFYQSFYQQYRAKLGLKLPRFLAIICYSVTQIYEIFIAGVLYLMKQGSGMVK